MTSPDARHFVSARAKAFASAISLEVWGWSIAAGGIASFVCALLLQHVWGLQPCPLCIVQRVAILTVSAAAALGVLLSRSRPRASTWIFRLVALLALAAMGIALKHMHVMWFPQEVSCGPDLEYLMDMFPPAKWLPKVFAGDAECAAAKELVLGLPIPIWSAIAFAAQACAALRAAFLVSRKA